MLLSLIIDAVCYLGLCLCPSPALAAENLFLRKQLALYEERQVKPARATNAIRLAMMWLSYCFDFIAWHRKGFRWFWRYKSKPGRPVLPKC
jgi:putative transposase